MIYNLVKMLFFNKKRVLIEIKLLEFKSPQEMSQKDHETVFFSVLYPTWHFKFSDLRETNLNLILKDTDSQKNCKKNKFDIYMVSKFLLVICNLNFSGLRLYHIWIGSFINVKYFMSNLPSLTISVARFIAFKANSNVSLQSIVSSIDRNEPFCELMDS